MADLSVYNRDKLWAKTSKAGLEFQTLTRNKTVIFCADELVNSLKLIANKSEGYTRVLPPANYDGFTVIKTTTK